MTNPNDAVGTNGAYGGRTSVNAFNDLAGAFTRGVVSGWACVPNTGLTVSLGGDGTNRDVAIAMDNIGDKTTINNISGAPIDVTIDSAPVSNSRIDLIVAYVDNPPQGTDTVADNPSACGLIVVKGIASASPTPPSDGDIRSAITADGASGTNAYYVVLAQITIASGTTTLTSSNISNGSKANLNNSNLPPIMPTNMQSIISTDANGWTKIALSSNINMYFIKGTTSRTLGANTWYEWTAATKPIDLDTNNPYFGGAGGVAADHAINVSGYVAAGNAKVQIQNQNIYNGSITTTIYWWGFIVETL